MVSPTQIARSRYRVESRFTETFTFFSEAFGEIPVGATDPEIVETVIHTAVPGRIKFPSLTVSDRESAGQLVAVQSPEVHVAVGSTPDVKPDHFARCTASTVDASLVGRKVRITGWPQSGQTTSHRWPVEVVS